MKGKKAILCHIIPIIIVVGLVWLFIFAIKLTYTEECSSNGDCGSNSYCGSDKKCHNMPTKVNRDFTSAIIIIGISLIIAFILLTWKRKEKVSNSGIHNHTIPQHTAHRHHHLPNQTSNLPNRLRHEQKR